MLDSYEQELAKAYCLSIQGKALLLCNKEFNPAVHKYGRAKLINSDYQGEEATLKDSVVDYFKAWNYTPSVAYQSIGNTQEFEDHLEILEMYLVEYENLTGHPHPVDELVLLLHRSSTDLIFGITAGPSVPAPPMVIAPFIATQATDVGAILRSKDVNPSLDFLGPLIPFWKTDTP